MFQSFVWKLAELWTGGRMWLPVTYVPTGLRALDSLLGGGFRTRGAHLLVGKTGHAKSQLAVTIAVNAARRGTSVGLFSLELGADEVGQLVAAQLGDIPRLYLARGSVEGHYSDRLKHVIEEYSGIPLYVLDDERWPGGLTRDGFGELLTEGVQRFGWRLVVVDYLGLIVAPDTDRDQFDSDLRNSTAMRRLARKHDVALLVVVTARKGTRFTKPEELTIDDIAGASRLVYDAQTVGVVWRQVGDADTGLVCFRPLKVRFATTRDDEVIQFRWHPRTGAILDLTPGECE